MDNPESHFATYLRSLSDNQLSRLFGRILERIETAFAGGSQFGIDIPTLRAVCPGFHSAYIAMRQEGRRRTIERRQCQSEG